MIRVAGIGWIDPQQYGCVRLGTHTTYAGRCSLSALAKTDNLFNFPVKSFGRFDIASKLTCYSVALALKDAGIAYAEDLSQDIAILGTSEDGCTAMNHEYFSDYVTCGRTLSRGNLFIYTLPTSPLAEAAIHFGLQGPLMYVAGEAESLTRVIDLAAGILDRGEATAAIMVRTDEETGLCLALSGDGDDDGLCDIGALQEVVKGMTGIEDIIDMLATPKEEAR